MRIAFDVSPLSHPPLGIGNYIRGSLGGLVEAAGGEHEIVAFAPTSLRGPERIRAALAGIDVELRTWRLPFSHALRTAWSRAGRPAAERLLGSFDVLHFSRLDVPAAARRSARDDDPRPRPAAPSRVDDRRARARCTRASTETRPRTCDVVFVNSRYTGDDVIATLGVPAERVHVAHPAARQEFRPDGPAADLGAPYVLTVATLEPRKNLQTLVEAHRLLGGELLLAVAGGEGWGDQPELDSSRIRRLGFVSDDELARLYRGAAAAVYPSRFEGFGIPVLEAMACGCPVVVSSHPSLDEASGDAAAARGPGRSGRAGGGDRARARRARAPRAQLGLAHAATFTWRSAGETFLRGYEEAAGR